MTIYSIYLRYNKLSNKDNTMTLARFMNYIQYSDKRPDNISAGRWYAMNISAENKYKKL